MCDSADVTGVEMNTPLSCQSPSETHAHTHAHSHTHTHMEERTRKEKTAGGCDAQKSMCFLTLFNGAGSARRSAGPICFLCVCTVGGRVDQCQTSLSLTLLGNLAFGHPTAQRSLLL